MLEWPGRCSHCKQPIEDWSQAASYEARWVHKACWREANPNHSAELATLLDSPVERGRILDWPMLFFLLLFHFGLGAAIAGWLLLTKVNSSETAAIIVFVVGVITPLIGVIGVAINIISRRRVESIRQSLDLQGGWKPGF